ALILLAGCRANRDEAHLPKSSTTDPQDKSEEWFTERAADAGLDFVHFNGMSGEFYYPEIMAPGVALLDYDNDGDLDVYLVQGQMLGGRPIGEAPVAPKSPLKDRLFRNDLVVHEDGTRTLTFTDVTEAAGINLTSYGMGVASGDFDNDGFVDIYRTGLGGSVL